MLFLGSRGIFSGNSASNLFLILFPVGGLLTRRAESSCQEVGDVRRLLPSLGFQMDQLRSTVPYKSHPSRPLRCNGSRSEVGAVDSEKGDQKRKDGRD